MWLSLVLQLLQDVLTSTMLDLEHLLALDCFHTCIITCNYDPLCFLSSKWVFYIYIMPCCTSTVETNVWRGLSRLLFLHVTACTWKEAPEEWPKKKRNKRNLRIWKKMGNIYYLAHKKAREYKCKYFEVRYKHLTTTISFNDVQR